MAVGQRIELMGVSVEITALTDGGYAPFVLPAVGETVTLPAAAFLPQ